MTIKPLTRRGRLGGDERLRILVVDDHDVVHWGFRTLLSGQSWVSDCYAASNSEAALELVRRHRPDVALVDLFLGDQSGAELCEKIRELEPETSVLLISGAGRISQAAAAAAGASGFVPKDWSAAEVAMAVRMVAKGMTVFPPRSDERGPSQISAREREVLVLIATGATNREIAAELFLSPHTVKEHTSSLYRKLEVRNRTEAVRRAERLGLTG